MKMSERKRKLMHRVWQVHKIDGIFGKIMQEILRIPRCVKNSERSNFFWKLVMILEVRF